MRGAVALPGSETISRRKGTRRNLGDLAWPAVAKAIPGRDGKARSQSRRGAGEESDGLVVPMKRSNKPVMNGGGGRGGKGPGRREGGRQCMLRTPSRASHVPGVVRLRIGAAGAAQLGMPITSDLRQEPGAGKPHAGICAGGGEESPSLPRPAWKATTTAKRTQQSCGVWGRATKWQQRRGRGGRRRRRQHGRSRYARLGRSAGV